MAGNGKLVIETPKGSIIKLKTRSGTVTSRIVWKDGFGPQYTAKFGTAQSKFDTEVLRICDRYVPMDTGVLKNSAQLASDIGGGQLVWDTPYAQKVYYTTGRTNGIRGKMWGHRCKVDNMPHFEKFAKGLFK